MSRYLGSPDEAMIHGTLIKANASAKLMTIRLIERLSRSAKRARIIPGKKKDGYSLALAPAASAAPEIAGRFRS